MGVKFYKKEWVNFFLKIVGEIFLKIEHGGALYFSLKKEGKLDYSNKGNTRGLMGKKTELYYSRLHMFLKNLIPIETIWVFSN